MIPVKMRPVCKKCGYRGKVIVKSCTDLPGFCPHCQVMMSWSEDVGPLETLKKLFGG